MRTTSPTMLADPAVDRLVTLARRRGRLTFEDLRANLPIATMSETAIAQAVARLEQAGVVIDVDEDVLEPVHGQTEPPPAMKATPAVSMRPGPTDAAAGMQPRTRLHLPRPKRRQSIGNGIIGRTSLRIGLAILLALTIIVGLSLTGLLLF